MKCLFIYNKESGKGKIEKYKDYILKSLQKKFGEIEVISTTYAGHATMLASKAKENYDYLFVAGGDGTLNEVVNGLGGKVQKPIIGYIPTGTVNDVAHSLGISRNIKRAVKTILNGEPFAHDIFKVNDKYGIYVCCAGLFTKSSYTAERNVKKAIGKSAYFFKGARELFDTKPVDIVLKSGELEVKQSAALMLVLNSRYVAGFRANKDASLNDGLVDVVLVPCNENKIKAKPIFKIAKLFTLGINYLAKRGEIIHFALPSFTLETSEATSINLDGEKSCQGTFEFTMIQKAVKILVTKGKK